MNGTAELARRISVAALVTLMAVLSIELFGIARLALQTRAFLWVIWIGPLLVFLPGLLRGSWKTHLWLCFVVMVYFTVTVSELFDPQPSLADWLELLLIVVIFVASMLFARWKQRELAGRGA